MYQNKKDLCGFELHPNCWTHSNSEGCSFSMAKFTADDKLAAVQRYLEDGET